MTKPNNYEELIKKFDKLFPLRYNGSTYRLEPGGENRKTIADFILKKVIPKAEAIGIEKGKEMERERILPILQAVSPYLSLSSDITSSDLLYRTPAQSLRESANALDKKDEAIRLFNGYLDEITK